MRILILSDSHQRKIEIKLSYDYLIHAGDYGNSLELLKNKKFYFVSGNCDLEEEKIQIFKINGRNILLTHGDLFNVKYDYNRLIYKALEVRADIVIFGHTHVPTFFKEEGIIFINPGAYKDGYYAVIDDSILSFYYNDKKIKTTNL